MSEWKRGNSAVYSRLACRLTILGMFRVLTTGACRDVSNGYLHTLTFSEPEPSYDEARRRWASFRKGFLERNGWFGVCVPQLGEETGRLHFHLVTTRRPDAKEWWRVLARYGFGRFDVRERPATSCLYAARYVGRGVGVPGWRSWSVFGAKRFPVCEPGRLGVVTTKDVFRRTKVLTVVAEQPQPFADWSGWRFSHDNETIKFRLRHDAQPDGPTIMREITKIQEAAFLNLARDGSQVSIGEYRGATVSTKEVAVYRSGQQVGSERRVVVAHAVDFGATAERRVIEEMLPSGADEKSVKAPAASGDLVAFVFESMFAGKGKTTWKGKLIKL